MPDPKPQVDPNIGRPKPGHPDDPRPIVRPRPKAS